ncbi:MAG: hypothetical protein RI995_919, partial [Bacteroidota bacterium]
KFFQKNVVFNKNRFNFVSNNTQKRIFQQNQVKKWQSQN